ncbi:MAG: phosphate ABC transporter permease PstA [Nitrospirae bacterium]|nr:phosphate ABC transporter permease PstA [Nitrospirota bacterium]
MTQWFNKLFRNGEPFIWLTAAALVISIMMVGGLLVLIMFKGLGIFWPSDLVTVKLKSGSIVMGQKIQREVIPEPGSVAGTVLKQRILLKVANRDVYGQDFRWIDESDIDSMQYPKDAVVFERMEWGDFYGFLKVKRDSGGKTIDNQRQMWTSMTSELPGLHHLLDAIKKVEKIEIGDINFRIEKLRLKIHGLEIENARTYGTAKIPESLKRLDSYRAETAALEKKYHEKEATLAELYNRLKESVIVVDTIDGRSKEINEGGIVRIYKPNDLGVFSKAWIYASKLLDFLVDDPREANTEGGVFPAIFGTVFMVLVMSVIVMPFGVLAALYLKEYAKQGLIVRIVRICVNNLAGVPSMVFGVFGLGFFIYFIGGTVDKFFFTDALPTPTFGTGGVLWASFTLALLTLPVVIVSTEEGLAAVPNDVKLGSLSLGANKFETLVHVIIPSALPGILTGLILAIARAAGEVAPLMITGVVKLAPNLPLDGHFPFVHLERKFMHLGFHIYDVGFQSPNVESAKPMVFMTTFLLILIVLVLNLAAIWTRNYLKKKYSMSTI